MTKYTYFRYFEYEQLSDRRIDMINLVSRYRREINFRFLSGDFRYFRTVHFLALSDTLEHNTLDPDLGSEDCPQRRRWIPVTVDQQLQQQDLSISYERHETRGVSHCSFFNKMEEMFHLIIITTRTETTTLTRNSLFIYSLGHSLLLGRLSLVHMKMACSRSSESISMARTVMCCVPLSP